MKKHWFTFVLVLMLVSLLGIGVLQWHWVSSVAAEQQDTFNRSVKRAVSNILREMDELSTVTMITNRFEQEAFWDWRPGNGDSARVSFKSVISSDNTDSIPAELREFTREILLMKDGSEEVEIIHSPDGKEQNVVVTRVERKVDTTETIYGIDVIDQKADVFFSALKEILVEKIDAKPDFEASMRSINLDSLIGVHMASNGISGAYQYGVVLHGTDSIWSQYSNAASVAPTDFEFSFPLYSNSNESPLLLLSFPDKTSQMLSGMAEVLILLGLFSLLILTTFGATIYYILRQKKLSAIKSDFINNMTHEFKTPLATIGLAVDSMRHPNVRAVPAEVDRLSGVIEQENKRMYGHVERILQLAKMESGELIIEKEKVDLNELLAEAVNNMKLQATSKDCQIELDLDENLGTIVADRSHLYNAVVNLLDNALKYCEQVPEIRLVSRKLPEGVSVFVKDNGVGMTPETQKRVTETFYRVEGGNVHNVKGFGLGLSYVREIVRLHGGELIIKSQPAKGSTIGFTIPVS